MCVVSRKNGFLALFFRIVAHSVDGSTTNSQKVTPGQKHICRVRNPGCHFRSAQPLDSQHQKTDFYTFCVCVCIFQYSVGESLTWPRKTLVIYPLSGLVNNVEVMWILAGNFFFCYIFLFILHTYRYIRKKLFLRQ